MTEFPSGTLSYIGDAKAIGLKRKVVVLAPISLHVQWANRLRAHVHTPVITDLLRLQKNFRSLSGAEGYNTFVVDEYYPDQSKAVFNLVKEVAALRTVAIILSKPRI